MSGSKKGRSLVAIRAGERRRSRTEKTAKQARIRARLAKPKNSTSTADAPKGRKAELQGPLDSIDLRKVHKNLKADEAVTLLEQWRDAAERHREAHCCAKGLAPYFMDYGFLRRFGYVAVNAFLAADQKAAFEASLKKAKRRVPAGSAVKETRYRIGLAALFPDVDADELRYMAYQLEFAWRHRVPAEFLVGFLRQSGPTASAERKVKDGVMEAWFTQRKWDSKSEAHAGNWLAESSLY